MFIYGIWIIISRHFAANSRMSPCTKRLLTFSLWKKRIQIKSHFKKTQRNRINYRMIAFMKRSFSTAEMVAVGNSLTSKTLSQAINSAGYFLLRETKTSANTSTCVRCEYTAMHMSVVWISFSPLFIIADVARRKERDWSIKCCRNITVCLETPVSGKTSTSHAVKKNWKFPFRI